MNEGCNEGVSCPDGLVRAGDQKLHASFAVLSTDFENVGLNLCTALRLNLRELEGGGGGGGGRRTENPKI